LPAPIKANDYMHGHKPLSVLTDTSKLTGTLKWKLREHCCLTLYDASLGFSDTKKD
jgi:hypothetical protein